jgi:acetyl-CoA decarbonylase/synthase complex subunit gamma
VAAHEVRKHSGFRVVYGPVRARDIPAFLASGMAATPEMRRVVFNLPARLVVVPVEMVMWSRYALLLMAGLILLAGLHRAGYDPGLALEIGLPAAGHVLLAFLGGLVLAPILLPWLPGRAFAAKGAFIGLLLAVGTLALGSMSLGAADGRLTAAGWLLLMPAISSFLTMNYTGTSTYTSLSGVQLEMRYAIPLQVGAGVLGFGLWVAGLFLRLH